MRVHIITYNVNRPGRGGGYPLGAWHHPVPRNIFVFIFFVTMYRAVCKFHATFCNFFKGMCNVTN